MESTSEIGTAQQKIEYRIIVSIRVSIQTFFAQHSFFLMHESTELLWRKDHSPSGSVDPRGWASRLGRRLSQSRQLSQRLRMAWLQSVLQTLKSEWTHDRCVIFPMVTPSAAAAADSPQLALISAEVAWCSSALLRGKDLNSRCALFPGDELLHVTTSKTTTTYRMSRSLLSRNDRYMWAWEIAAYIRALHLYSDYLSWLFVLVCI